MEAPERNALARASPEAQYRRVTAARDVTYRDVVTRETVFRRFASAIVHSESAHGGKPTRNRTGGQAGARTG